jgi:hypothetical protein
MHKIAHFKVGNRNEGPMETNMRTIRGDLRVPVAEPLSQNSVQRTSDSHEGSEWTIASVKLAMLFTAENVCKVEAKIFIFSFESNDASPHLSSH